MPRKTKLDKGVVKRGVVCPDKHFPLADPKAISCFLQAIAIIKPDFYVDIGDVGECVVSASNCLIVLTIWPMLSNSTSRLGVIYGVVCCKRK